MLLRFQSLKTDSLHALSAVCLAFSLTGLLVSTGPAAADDIYNDCPADKEIVDSAMKGVVAIYMPDTGSYAKPIGTGFFITNDGYVLTAAHVITDPQTNKSKGSTFRLLLVKDKLMRNKFLDAQIISRNSDLDLAILKVVSAVDAATLLEIHALPLRMGSTDTNFNVLGNPSGNQDRLFICNKGTRKAQDSNGLETVKETLDSGYSGGPVIDSTGSVVAIALRQGDYPESFLRRVDTIREFLEANEIVESGEGQEKHLSLSSLATVERVAALESQLKELKQKVEVKQFVIEEMKKQLVHWTVTICEIPRPPKVVGEPKHRMTIQFDKPSTLIDPKTDDKFEAQIIPNMMGETGLEARARNLIVLKAVTFDGQKWSVEPLDDDVGIFLRNYNEKEHPSHKLEMKNIDSFTITLEPPDGNDELQYLGFEERPVKFTGGDKCDLEQPNSVAHGATASQ